MIGMRTPLAAAALALLGACLDTPSDPTWVEDVRPIVMANCVRCHGTPALSVAPDSFRLDAYGTTYGLWVEGAVDGAAAEAGEMVEEATPNEEGRIDMPPRFHLTDRQQDILIAWSDAFDPDAERPGPPRTSRSDNHPPEIQISELRIDERGGHAELFLYDEDPEDYLTGMVYVVPVSEKLDRQPKRVFDVPAREPFAVLLLDEGPSTLDFTTDHPLFDRFTSNHYDVFLEIDDGIDAVTVDLGFIDLVAREGEP